MKCPLKFSRYEFEGGEECIGAECGFFGGVCGSVDAHSKAHSKTEQLLTEQSESSSDESDSREKLEADVYNHIAISITPNKEDDGVLAPYATVLEWLDRQKAITERETRLRELYRFEENHRASIDKTEEVNRKLNDRIAELTEQLEAAHAKNRALKLHISKMQSGRHGWHVRGVELEKENAELQAAYDELTGIAAQLCRACGFSMVDAAGEVVS